MMKSLTMATWLGFLVCLATTALGETLGAQLREQLSPLVREWVTQEAEKLRHTANPEEVSLKTDLQLRFRGQSLATADHDRLVYLIFLEAVQAADRELHNDLAQLKANREAAKPQPTPATSPILQMGTSGPMPRSGPPNGAVLGGNVTVGQNSLGTATGSAVPPGTLAVTPEQALRFRTMNNVRNQLVTVLNNLTKKVAIIESESLLPQLK